MTWRDLSLLASLATEPLRDYYLRAPAAMIAVGRGVN